MNDSLYIAATGMQAQQQTLDTIANNLVNVNTPAFKKSRVNFNELMHVEPHKETSAGSGASNILGVGISVERVAKDFAPGILSQTSSPLDLAINGNGFIEVTLPDGSRGYTRGGTMQITKDSFLATSAGYALKPAIHIPANITSLTIEKDGKVLVQTSAKAQPVEIGHLEMASFSNPAGLKAAGAGVYVPTEASGQAVYGKPGSQGMGTIAQGSLEASNVSLVDEMVTLMVAQRAYELSSKVAQASDEVMSMTNNLRR
jgi:flagellar basal-body rod protein FlgG